MYLLLVKSRISFHQVINCVKANQPDFTVLVSGSYDATVRCWDIRSRNKDPIQIMDDAKDSVPTVQISDHTILTGCVYFTKIKLILKN